MTKAQRVTIRGGFTSSKATTLVRVEWLLDRKTPRKTRELSKRFLQAEEKGVPGS
ncbi:hypothetical protein NADFUDRAFT_81779 [Nadsonia fulvescens var. elongata DSM 6958]|uniref:Uncharacterized protein n=1 Tax=Nadsonia fulvescens var. elongata DSM 6958 TaxID=857566 RepID=A0A1E3PP62_9ASCO|nr:hypothetical protein NADFUDRAFT_81779 [Nadsonia fulvescens var. elongata DSM 6958]